MLNINLKDLAENIKDSQITEVEEIKQKDIAIIGISARLPMADNLKKFWDNLKNGVNCITDLPEERKLETDNYFKYKRQDVNSIKYKKGSYLKKIDEFDYKFFNISPREASLMDPNQRIFLQIAMQAIEDSGYGGDKLKGSRTGVYFGFVSDSAYQRFIGEIEPTALGSSIPGNMASIIPGRVSYVLDLKGPSLMIDTACSSSLVAVHTACNAIRNGDCDMALVGSGKINLVPIEDNNMMGIESKDYTCKAFDDDSEGTCMGEGYMALLLKPVSKAVKDNDNIYAVIKGSAVNQDGTSMGLTAPNSLAQADVIDYAWKDADIKPETITYIEAHGTGTKLGDPIEVDGITKAFRKYTDSKQFCGIGSVKTNLGHLDSAAGMVGLIKVVLALKYQMLPPSINFRNANKNIDFENSPVYVNHLLSEWSNDNSPRRCGVSAFGLSGTNCHIVLEEAKPLNIIKASSNNHYIFTLSAKSYDVLTKLAKQYIEMLKKGFTETLNNLCYTANTGRGHYSNRLIFIFRNINEFESKLKKFIECDKYHLDKDIFYKAFKITSDEKDNNGEIKISTTEIDRISKIADTKIKAYKESTKTSTDTVQILNELCELYVSGAKVNWEEFYIEEKYKKISLPVYAFEKNRCWIEIPEVIDYKYENKVEEKKVDYTLEPKKIDIVLSGNEDEQYTKTEKQIAQVWAEVLGFDEIDIQEDFYELGGDSIIAMEIAVGLSKLTGEEIKVSHIMRYLTVKELAKYMDEALVKNEEISEDTCPIKPLDKKEYYSLSAAQKRIYLIEQLSDTGTSYNMPVAVMIEGSIDRQKVEEVFNKMINRHEALRTSFKSINGESVQIIHDTVDFSMNYLEINEIKCKASINSLIKPFNLNQAPLFRASLIQIEDNKHVLLYDVHHIIADGVSLAILLNEFNSLYQSIELPKLRFQYKDYAAFHNNLLLSDEIKNQEKYWLNQYSGEILTLDMPLDFKRPKVQVFTGNTVEFELEPEMITKVNEIAQTLKITLNSFLLSTYSLLISMYSNQSNIVVGSLVAGRTNEFSKNVIGMFVNFLPLKFKIDRQGSFSDYLNQSNEMILEGFENQDYPFDMIVENISSKLDRSRNPLFDTVFIFHNELKEQENFELDGLTFKNYKIETNSSKLDFKIDAYITKNGGVKCVLEYNTSLFKEESMKIFSKHYRLLINKAINDYHIKLNEIKLFSPNEKQIIDDKKLLNNTLKNKIKLVVSATFTSEPINDYITWWCNQAQIQVNVEFAPYNQVFQQLLDSDSLLSQNNDLNLILVRPEDWIRNDHSEESVKCTKLEEKFDQLVEILKNKGSQTECFFGICPVSTHLSLSEGLISYIENMNNRWNNALELCENIHIIDFNKLHRLYHVNEIFDIYKDREGHMPFSDGYYAAMGTYIARKICSWKKPQFKVVVLDCDNTLWKGICGEEGASGVIIDQDFTALQQFMLEKYNSGMLLALCSKNNEQDVWDVFNENTDMVLKREHFVDWRINWQSKAENIKSLAQSLNLGLDSFIFIDDNPVECALVMEECPKVLTLQLPEDTQSIPTYLQHIWAFDIFKVTDEDKNRTQLYTTEKKRKKIQDSNISLDDFIKSLEIKVSMNQMNQSQIERVSQLTMRTNQFNLSTIRRSEAEIAELTKNDQYKIWVVEAMDKFGDYGLVGVIVTKNKEKNIFIDTFLLSCRVLGRGVEGSILYMLGKYAREVGAEYIDAEFYPTEKNMPFNEFLMKSGWYKEENLNSQNEKSVLYRMNVNHISQNLETIDCYYMCTINKANNDSKESEKEKKAKYTMHHIAIAVKDIAIVKKEYLKNGYECGNAIHDPLQNAYLMMCTKKGHSAVELVAPVNNESPINRVIKENENIPYHVCYIVDNCKKYLEELESNNIQYEIISHEKRAVLFNNDMVMFIKIKGFGLVELLESEDKNISSTGNVNNSILQIISSDIEKANEFLTFMSYIQEKSIYNTTKKLRLSTYNKPGEGRIEIVIPTDNSSIEYEFLQRNGVHAFKLYTQLDKPKKKLMNDYTWEVMNPNNRTFLHHFYLIALRNYSEEALMSLPVFESNINTILQAEYEAPANEVEEKLVTMWQDILAIEKIGVNNSFFELGGHSLKATILVAQICKEFNVDITLTDLFKSKTIRQLANLINNTGTKIFGDIEPIENKDYYSLSAAQKRIYLIHQLNSHDTSYNIPAAVMIEGYIDRKKVEDVLNQIIQRHEILRTSFTLAEGEPMQIVENIDKYILTYKEADGSAVENMINTLVKPFDLTKAPLFRACLIRIADNKHILFYEMHHIVSDGFSYALLMNEFISLYQGIELPLPRIQYKDYAVWHNNLLESEEMKNQEKYWLDKYTKNNPVLDFPLDYERPKIQNFSGSKLEYTFDSLTVTNLNKIAKDNETTLNTVLFSLYTLILHKYCMQDEIVVGSLVAGRRHASLNNMIGMFVNFLPIKCSINSDSTILDFLKVTRNTILEAYDNQDYPFDILVEKVITKADRSRNPLFDTAFIFHNEFEASGVTEIADLKFSSYELNTKTSTLDFKMDVYPIGDNKLKCVIEYNTSLLKDESIFSFFEKFKTLINKVVDESEQLITDIKLFSEEENRNIQEKKKLNMTKQFAQKLVISATFTSEPIEEYIKWWCNKFNINIDVQFAPYNQVFQQILDGKSLYSTNDGINTILVRFEDWIRNDKTSEDEQFANLEENLEKLIQILKTQQSEIPCFIGIFPVSTHLSLSSGMMSYLKSMYRRFKTFIENCKNTYILDFTELDNVYYVDEIFDPYTDKEGHVPFSEAYFSAMGTFIARKICAYKKQQFKVIVLDCDNTLWNGVCGEDGTHGITIDDNFAELQKFMVNQYNGGKLITLCSKNNENDVWDVFENNPNMLLKREHIVSWRINWQSKAENIKELAEELNLGLDSFIFIDDNPVECALVMEECPKVLTVQIPENANNIPAFLQHIWAFDILKITKEDKNRTNMYVSEKSRKALQNTKLSLENFIKSLELKVSFNEMETSQVERVAQLTQRTNQFNLSTIRRTERELTELTDTSGFKCWIVEVSDKFGDYGLVGVVITKENKKMLFIDTFILSCRVLGRGVENTILNNIGKYACEAGAEYIQADFYPTQKNIPFKEFLTQSQWCLIEENNNYLQFRIDADTIDETSNAINSYYKSSYNKEIKKRDENITKQYNGTENKVSIINEEKWEEQSVNVMKEIAAVKDHSWNVMNFDNDKLLHNSYLFALQNHCAFDILNLPIQRIIGRQSGMPIYRAPESDTEKELAGIYQIIFGIETIGADDSFLDLGGSSLKAISLVTHIYKHFHVEISIIDVFNKPTVSELAKSIENAGITKYYHIPEAQKKLYYPLSSAQKRLYIMQQLDLDSTMYNEPAIVEIEGVVDRQRLENVFRQLLNRHESLRTSFEIVEDNPVQKIHKELEFSITYIETTQDELQEMIKQSITCFDLSKVPLLNVYLISVSNNKHVLVCDMHHIITDGVSIVILIREFIKLYNNEKLPELRIQYKDFSEWQNTIFTSDKIKIQEEFWLNKLSNNIPVLNMPTDYLRQQIQSFDGATYKYEVVNEVIEQLEGIIKETGVTMYMLLLAVFNILLSKYTGQEDIIIGSPISGRPHSDLQNTIGMFVNTLAMRNQPQGNKTFIGFLQDVKVNSLEAFDNQDLQFEQLVNKLGLNTDISRNPLFDVVFVLQQNDIPQIQIEGLKFKRYEMQNTVSKFDITLEVEVSEGGISLLFKYCTKLYNCKTIENMAKDYLKIIQEIIKDKNIQLKDIKLFENYIKSDRAIKEEISFAF